QVVVSGHEGSRKVSGVAKFRSSVRSQVVVDFVILRLRDFAGPRQAGPVARRDLDGGVLLGMAVVADVPLAAPELPDLKLAIVSRVEDFRRDFGPLDRRPADLAGRVGARGKHALEAQRIA